MDMKMDSTMRARFFKYLVSHYERMPMAKIEDLMKVVKERIASSGYFTIDVLETVINEMQEEGMSIYSIMAHLDLLDIEERT